MQVGYFQHPSLVGPDWGVQDVVQTLDSSHPACKHQVLKHRLWPVIQLIKISYLLGFDAGFFFGPCTGPGSRKLLTQPAAEKTSDADPYYLYRQSRQWTDQHFSSREGESKQSQHKLRIYH